MDEKEGKQNLEIELTVLRYIEKEQNQKSLSEKIGISVGKTNYILKALVQKGFVKVENFMANENKRVYRYLLTKEGLAEKIRLTETFIERKKSEYEELQKELEKAKKEL